MIILGTAVILIALTPSYTSITSDLYVVPSFLLVLTFLALHDESTGIQLSGVNTVLDQQSQSVLTSLIVLIEYLLFAGFCVPF
jgi:hypothetical protein